MLFKQKKRLLHGRTLPLILLILSVVLLFPFYLANAHAISDTNNHEGSCDITEDNKYDDNEEILYIEENQESTSVLVNSDKLIPENPQIKEEKSHSKIIVAELEKKTGVPEVYDDGRFRYYLVDGAYYEVEPIYQPCYSEIVIPSELFGVPIKGIKSYAFKQFTYLVSVVIPDSVEYIGDYAFHNCPNLISVFLPRNEIKFGEGVFQFSE